MPSPARLLPRIREVNLSLETDFSLWLMQIFAKEGVHGNQDSVILEGRHQPMCQDLVGTR